MEEVAILLTGGLFRTPFAKTAHGLIRGPSRYALAGVVDPTCAGEDAGELLDGLHRGIPVAESVSVLLHRQPRPGFCVVGVATEGGRIPPGLREELVLAARAGLSLVAGLHELLSADAELVSLAARSGAKIIDIRKPRPVRTLRFWTGASMRLATPRVAVLGTDCAVGKRTTCASIRAGCRERGIRAEMIYTGQTGWLQGVRHGFILDATPNDFVAGELEGAVLACQADTEPDLILIEGQSALRNPSGPCGAELLLSAGAKGVILQHAPGRRWYEGFEGIARIPPVREELALVRLYGAEVWGLSLNAEDLSPQRAEAERAGLEDELGVPVVLALRDGPEALVDAIERRIEA